MASGWQNAPSLLTRLVQMMEQDAEKDDAEQKSFRKVMENNPEQFLATYERVEARARTKKNGKSVVVPEPPAVATVVPELSEDAESEEHREKMEEIIDRLKASWAERYPKSRNGH